MKKVRNYPVIINIVVATLIIFIILLRLVGCYYAINDDISMHNLAAGTVTGIPDGHLIFIKYPLGLVMAGLFKLFPQIDWYGLILIGLLFLCYVLIVVRLFFVAKEKGNAVWRWIFGLSLMVCLFLNSTILFQFTTVAGILGATAVFILTSSDDNLRAREYILVWFLMIMVALLRLKVFYMMVPLCGVIVVIQLLKQIRKDEGGLKIASFGSLLKKYRKKLIQFLIITVVGMLVFGAVRVIEGKVYSKEPWKSYMEYKHARSMIMDYYGWPPYEGHEEFWDSIGFSKEAYECLNMYGVLPEMDTEAIIKIADYSGKIHKDSLSSHHSIKGMFTVFVYAATNTSCMMQNIILLFMLVVLLIYFIRADRFHRWCIVAGVIVQLGILGYILYQGRFPTRIIMTYDFQCIMAIFGVVLAGWIPGKKALRNVLRIAGTVVCAVMLVLTMTQAAKIVRNSQKKLGLYEEKMAYIDSMPDKILVSTGSSILTAKRFSVQENIVKRNVISTYGWSVLSPWYDKKYEELRIDKNNHILLYPDVYFLTHKPGRAEKIKAYYRSLGIETDYELLEKKYFSDYSQLCVLKFTPIYPDPFQKEKLFMEQQKIREEQVQELLKQEMSEQNEEPDTEPVEKTEGGAEEQ